MEEPVCYRGLEHQGFLEECEFEHQRLAIERAVGKFLDQIYHIPSLASSKQ